MVTSGAESNEWIAAGRNRDPNARVPDTSDARVLDTSGSEMPNVEEDDPNMYEDILEELLAERRPEVQLYAQINGVSDNVAAQHIVEDALAAMGAHPARDASRVRRVIDIELETFWRTHRPNQPSSRAVGVTPRVMPPPWCLGKRDQLVAHSACPIDRKSLL